MRTVVVLAVACVFFSVVTQLAPPSTRLAPRAGATNESLEELSQRQVRAYVFDAVESHLELIHGQTTGVAAAFRPGTPLEYVHERLERLRSLTRFDTVSRWGSSLDTKGVALTYSFPPDGTDITGFGFVNDGAVADPNERINHMFARWNALFGDAETWKEFFRQAFQQVEAVTGVQYTEVSDDGAIWPSSPGPFNGGVNRGDIRIVSALDDGSGVGIVAFNYYPEIGDMFMDSADANLGWYGDSTDNYRIFRNTVIHENGHGLGLDHSCPQNSTKVMEPFINDEFDGPQLDDILGLQSFYGDRFELGVGNDTIAAATDALSEGLAFDSQPHSIRDMSLNATADRDVFRIDVTATSDVDAVFTVVPKSGSYLAGEQNPDDSCSGGSVYDPSSQADLRLALRDLSDLSLTTVDNNGAGQSESLNAVLEQGQSYTIEIDADLTESFIDLQLYNLAATMTPQGLAADITGDGCVNGSDLALLLAQWGVLPGAPSDLNQDGIVDGADLAALLASWQPCP